VRLAAVLAIALAAHPAAAAPPTKPTPAKPAAHLAWRTDEAAAFAAARAAHKGVLVDVTAAWCLPCGELAARLDAEAATIEAAFIPLRIDVSDESDAAAAVRKRYGATTLPAVVFTTATAEVVERITQLVDAEALRAAIKAASDELRRRAPRSRPRGG
jgi:thiol:disulfide interchange protein